MALANNKMRWMKLYEKMPKDGQQVLFIVTTIDNKAIVNCGYYREGYFVGAPIGSSIGSMDYKADETIVKCWVRLFIPLLPKVMI